MVFAIKRGIDLYFLYLIVVLIFNVAERKFLAYNLLSWQCPKYREGGRRSNISNVFNLYVGILCISVHD